MVLKDKTMISRINTPQWFSDSLRQLSEQDGKEIISYGLEIKLLQPVFGVAKDFSEIDGWKILEQEPKAEKVFEKLWKNITERKNRSTAAIQSLLQIKTLFFARVAPLSIERITITKENEHDVYFIFVEKGATCTITLDEIGSHVVCLYAEEGSKVIFHTYSKEKGNTLSLIEAEIAKNVEYEFVSHIEEGHYFVGERFITVLGEGSDVRSNTYIEAKEGGVVDVREYITLCANNSDAEVIVRGVGEKKSRIIVRGNIHAKSGLQNLYGNQSFAFLMLDNDAEVDAMPDLSIEANAVSFSHACAIHDIPSALSSYLYTRGFDAETARGMYKDAFLQKRIAE